MEKIIINDFNLNENDIETTVIRVKGLIINSSGKILIAHNNNTYQFPGGHLDDCETMEQCLKREIKDETGINVDILEEAFLCISTYDNNYFNSGKKVLNNIYYFRIFTDEVPNYDETHYDELELASDFNLFYVEFNDLENFLKKCIDDDSIDKNIGREMLLVVDTYNKIYGGNV